MKALERTDSFSKVNWSNKRLAVGLGSLIIYFAMLRLIVLPYLLRNNPNFYLISATWVMAALWMLLFPLFCIYKDNLMIWEVSFSNVLKEAVVALGFLIVVIIIMSTYHLIVEHIIQEPLDNPWVRFGKVQMNSKLILFLTILFTIVPVAEELFFRGFVYNALSQRFNIYFCALMQAIIFALFHYKNPYNSIYNLISIFLMGIILVITYERRKTLLSPVLVHGFHIILGVTLQRAYIL